MFDNKVGWLSSPRDKRRKKKKWERENNGKVHLEEQSCLLNHSLSFILFFFFSQIMQSYASPYVFPLPFFFFFLLTIEWSLCVLWFAPPSLSLFLFGSAIYFSRIQNVCLVFIIRICKKERKGWNGFLECMMLFKKKKKNKMLVCI